MASRRNIEDTQTLMPLTVDDVDLIRFEKNLLQIGFFGAHDTRYPNKSERRIEQVVFRAGQKIKVAAEFRGSAMLGLPSTADRDKFIAFLKIVGEDRAKIGRITNPIRFSGYRLIRELGVARTGDVYEEIVRWGKRMSDTTITSEQVVYFADKKRYSDETLHVFRSFKRTGTSNLKDGEKQENYEVVLEDWLLENLNQRYVIPEDFNAYKKLTRPTAKGIFGNLHLWFHASQGRKVEKDYAELCNLLNIKPYSYLSKIKETMGRSLDELVTIKYLSDWGIQPMTTKEGYKILLSPGAELLRHLASSPRKQIADKTSDDSAFNQVEQEAINALLRHGIIPAKAKELVETCDPSKILDQVEYLESQLALNRKSISNPAGFIIYSIKEDLPVPVQFVTSRKARELKEKEDKKREKQEQEARLQCAYNLWVDEMRSAAVADRYPGEQLTAKIREIVIHRTRTDDIFKRVVPSVRENLALSIIRQEIAADLMLPTFEQWCSDNSQGHLF
jgi:Replication initiator protein A